MAERTPFNAIRSLYEKLTGQEPKDIFEKLLRDGLRQDIQPGRTQKARDWYRDKAKETQLEKGDVFKNVDRQSMPPKAGEMFMFGYLPKHIETLPYHDRLPCVIPFDRVKNGFIGLNMHYLPLPARAQLMDALYTVASDMDMTEETKINIRYQMIEGLARFRFAKPCIKHYLFDRVQTRFVKINSSEWDIALFLPLEQFAKGKGMPLKKNMVEAQRDSMNRIRGK